MMRLLSYVATSTELLTGAGFITQDPGAHTVLLDWLRFHDLDPYSMPVENRIVRNVEACRIEFDQFVRDERGDLVLDEARTGPVVVRTFVQGETPPLPWPAEFTEVVRTRRLCDPPEPGDPEPEVRSLCDPPEDDDR